MNTIDVATWEECEQHVKELRKTDPLMLFRGQGDADWRLTTTLERAGQEKMPFMSYFEVINRFQPEIETFTEMTWDLPSYREVIGLVKDPGFLDGLGGLSVGSLYPYLLYLRHHRFPSPLLDWTRSPYVAAFFAFRQKPRSKHSGKMSIYVFSEMPNGIKGTHSNQARIKRMGPYVRSHKRHFLQHSDYTICVQFDNHWVFQPHEDVFQLNHPSWDLLTKINIPATERTRALKVLDEHNLNAFSLFGSEDELMETMAFRAFDLRKAAFGVSEVD